MKSIIKKLGKTSITVEKDYHSSNKEYNKLTIVEEQGAFKTYLSRKPVPVGIELTNREYWIPFSGVLESIVLDYLKFKQDYGSGKNLEDNAIITRHIRDRNVTGNKIADDAITTEKIVDDSIIISKLSTDIQFLISNLSKTSTFAGIATPTTNPGTPDGSVFYFANSAGIYTNFNNIKVLKGENIILKWNNNIWTKNVFKPNTDFDSVFDANGKSLTEFESGIVYDVSAHNNGVIFESLQALLNSSNLSTLIPMSVRHGGMSIRFVQSPANKYVQWRLVSKYWNTDVNNWVAENEDFRNNVMQEVNTAVASIKPIEVTGDVTNAPDEEDITSINVGGTDVLKFKDKPYTPLTYSGMGRKILRKNVVDGVNTLTQSMINQPNTIYEIRYDFDLSGTEITIPDNCILQFDGGSLRNGVLLGDFRVKAPNSKIFYSISFIGNVQNTLVANLEWFVQNWSTKMDYKLDATDELQEAFDSGIIRWLINENRYYYITKTIIITKTIFIDTTLRNNYSTTSNSLGHRVYLQEGSIYSDKEVTLIKYIHKGMNGNFHNTHIYLSGLRLHTTKVYTDITEESKNTPILYIEVSPDLPYLQADGIDLDVAISSQERTGALNFTGVEIYAKNQGILFLNLRGNIFRTYYGMYFHYDSPYWFNGINIDCTTTCNFGSRDSIVGNGVIIKGFHQTFQQPNEFNAKKAYFNFSNSYAYFYGLLYDMGRSTASSSSPSIALNCKVSRNILAPTSYDGETLLNRSVMSSTDFYSNEINIVGNKIGENIVSLHDNGNFYYIDYNESSINNKSFKTFINEGKLSDINYLTGGISTTDINSGGPNTNYEVAGQAYSLCKADVTEENSEDGIYTIKTVIRKGSFTLAPSTTLRNQLLLEVNTALFYMPNSVVLVNMYNRSGNIIESIEKHNDSAYSILNNFYVTKSLFDSIVKIEFINTVQFKADSKVSYISIPRVRVSLLDVSFGNKFNNMFVAEPFPLRGSNFVSIFSRAKNKPLYCARGLGWVDSEGNPADAISVGNFSNKPLASSGIKVGFQYFCTDRQTTEGSTNGIMIYHKGNDVWVDALGRVVS